MTRDEGLRLICQAALMENGPAKEYLCEQLDQCWIVNDGEAQLLLALAWLSPENALKYGEELNVDQEGITGSIQKLQEAHEFHALSAEGKTAHRTLTELLPGNSPEVERRRRGYSLSQLIALEAEPGMDSRVAGNTDQMNPFFLARMWMRNSDFWVGLIGLLPAGVPLMVIGQFILELRATPADLARLAGIAQQRCRSQSKPITDTELSHLLHMLSFLEPRVPEKLIPIIPDMLRIIDLERNKNSAMLMARVLVLIARLGLGTDKTILPLLRHLGHSQVSEQSQHWSRQVQQYMENFIPVPREAYELVKLL